MKGNIKKKKFWIVTELFYPNETSTAFYLTEIAKKISKIDEVNVICNSSLYELNTNIVGSENFNFNKILIHSVPSINLNKNFLFTRAIKMIINSIVIFFFMVIKIKKNDKIWLVTNPIILLPFAGLVSYFKNNNYTIIVHDVFPENLVSSKILKENNYFYKFMKIVFDYSFSFANNIIVCGRDMENLMIKKLKRDSINIKLIENWADTKEVNPHLFTGNRAKIFNNIKIKDNDIILQFAGNLGRLQGIIEMVAIFKKVKNKNLIFIFIGEGAMKTELLNEIRGYSNFYYVPSFPRKMQNDYLSSIDIGIVSLNDPILGVGVPSKTYNILAANKPILYFGNAESEIAKMVNENSAGWCFDFNEQNKVIFFLENLTRESILAFNNRHLAIKLYSKESILEKYKNFYESL